MLEKMTIGRLAGAAGVNIETVRFYQRSGLIDEPPRPIRGYRIYGGDHLRRIRFIKRAQLLGFTLDEVATLLRLDGSRACSSTRELTARKLVVVQSKLGDLLAMQTALVDMLARCDSEKRDAVCPIIQSLLED